jgi:hypothetical protein
LIKQILLIVIEIEDKAIIIKIPNELEEFRDIFIKREGIDALPDHIE